MPLRISVMQRAVSETFLLQGANACAHKSSLFMIHSFVLRIPDVTPWLHHLKNTQSKKLRCRNRAQGADIQVLEGASSHAVRLTTDPFLVLMTDITRSSFLFRSEAFSAKLATGGEGTSVHRDKRSFIKLTMSFVTLSSRETGASWLLKGR